MELIETRFANLLGSLSASLQLPMLLPSAVLVLGSLWLIQPQGDFSQPGVFWGISFVIITTAYLFYAFNREIIRLFEGYIFANTPLMQGLRKEQRDKFKQFRDTLKQAEENIDELKYRYDTYAVNPDDPSVYTKEMKTLLTTLENWLFYWIKTKDSMSEELELHYPPEEDRVLATRFGNTTAAYEAYPKTHYDIDMIQMWSRLFPLIKDETCATLLSGEAMVQDFFVNLIVVCIGLWCLSFGIFAITGRLLAGGVVFVLPLIAYVFYKGACEAAMAVGTVVKAIFDLYRFRLQEALYFKDTGDGDEKAIWKDVSDFMAATEPQISPSVLFKYSPQNVDN